MDFAVPFTDGPGSDFAILTNSQAWGALADTALFEFFLDGTLQDSFTASLYPDELFQFDLSGSGLVADRIVVTNITPDPPGTNDLATMTFDDAGVAYPISPPITVNSTSGGTGGPDCTLRDAITAADTDTATGGCPAGAGADTIVLTSGATYTLTEVDNDVDGRNGLPVIQSQITIEGNGSTIERSSDSGTHKFRIFYLAAGGDLVINDLTIQNGYAPDLGDFMPYPTSGGGIFNNQGALTLSNTSILNNTASGVGGGIYNKTGSLTMTNSMISGNSTDMYEGGGMFNSESDINLTNVTFENNSSFIYGGGIYNTYVNAILTNVTFTNNTASGGGGMYEGYGCSSILENVTFSGNWTDGVGGGMVSGGFAELTDVTFIDNIAHSGGGMYGIGTLTDVNFYNNTANWGGGMRGNGTMKNVTFIGNSAVYGGGLAGGGTLSNVLFSGNTAGEYGGGMYKVWDNSAELTNVTFSNNTAAIYGGGMFNGGINPTLANVILWSNSASAGGDQIYNNGTTSMISHSLIQDSGGSGAGWDASLGVDGGGNIDTDPLFVDALNGDLHLNPGSPAIDAGDDGVCPPTDLDGVARPQGAACDMGAYEFEVSEPELINDLLNQDAVSTSYERKSAPNAPKGIYTISSTFSNLSSTAIEDIHFLVTELSGGNLLLNADDGPGGVGATLTVPPEALGDNGLLDPGESFTVEFEIGLQRRRGFSFFVDAYGIPGGSAANTATAMFGGQGFEYEVSSGDLGIHELFLPSLGK
ncbi:choice-of-anchor Q domain-containing protein [Chloroflexota bacterium]